MVHSVDDEPEIVGESELNEEVLLFCHVSIESEGSHVGGDEDEVEVQGEDDKVQDMDEQHVGVEEEVVIEQHGQGKEEVVIEDFTSSQDNDAGWCIVKFVME
ncbi:hypothetical protein LR48_Vigan09g048700 [Vigna angularis]|uniref:Uncharacterized protein n=1 Tax=Phaseolus angularis TaxID=3914 RepID=A0A0L9V9Z6_PHAAN|nr:hypothetical protein LR48_Vigan09g048700 [Vigna angularis]